MKRIAILGSTGSIGTSALKIAQHLSNELQVVGLAAKQNIDLLEQQAHQFHPRLIAVEDKQQAAILARRLPAYRVVGGVEGLQELAADAGSDCVVSALSGMAGLLPTLAAIQAGKTIALANKEPLVAAGAYVMEAVRKHGARILPVDSEHSALFQCLVGENIQTVNRLILTASGGPFRTWSPEQLKQVTIEQALRHPNWKMGKKVTIDCSTLMNKGLELIEAHWLFGIPIERIEVVFHPQSIIHSLVEFVDGSLKAQMGEPDMVTAIQYALTYPERRTGTLEPFNFLKHPCLEFFSPDERKFPCLSLAYQALRCGGSMTCYMNAANEVIVQRFLEGKIGWIDIAPKLAKLMASHRIQKMDSLEAVLGVDEIAREEALTA